MATSAGHADEGSGRGPGDRQPICEFPVDRSAQPRTLAVFTSRAILSSRPGGAHSARGCAAGWAVRSRLGGAQPVPPARGHGGLLFLAPGSVIR